MERHGRPLSIIGRRCRLRGEQFPSCAPPHRQAEEMAPTLHLSRLIVAAGLMAITLIAPSANANAPRVKVTPTLDVRWFAPRTVVLHPHASFTLGEDLIDRYMNHLEMTMTNSTMELDKNKTVKPDPHRSARNASCWDRARCSCRGRRSRRSGGQRGGPCGHGDRCGGRCGGRCLGWRKGSPRWSTPLPRRPTGARTIRAGLMSPAGRRLTNTLPPIATASMLRTVRRPLVRTGGARADARLGRCKRHVQVDMGERQTRGPRLVATPQ